jgi:hypothetical protein
MNVATLAREWIDRNELAVFHRLATVATTKKLRRPYSLNGIAFKNVHSLHQKQPRHVSKSCRQIFG